MVTMAHLRTTLRFIVHKEIQWVDELPQTFEASYAPFIEISVLTYFSHLRKNLRVRPVKKAIEPF